MVLSYGGHVGDIRPQNRIILDGVSFELSHHGKRKISMQHVHTDISSCTYFHIESTILFTVTDKLIHKQHQQMMYQSSSHGQVRG